MTSRWVRLISPFAVIGIAVPAVVIAATWTGPARTFGLLMAAGLLFIAAFPLVIMVRAMLRAQANERP